MKKIYYIHNEPDNDEALFLSSVTKAMDKELEEEAARAGKDVPMPPQLEARVRALCKDWRRQEGKAERKRILFIGLKWTARVAAVALVLHTGLYMSVEAYRVGTKNMAQSFQDGVATYVFHTNPESGVLDMVYQGTTPEGFINIVNQIVGSDWFARYEKGKDWFTYERILKNAQYKFQGPTPEPEDNINGLSAMFTIGRDGRNVVTWYSDTYIYCLSGSLAMDELTLMAESVPTD